MQKNLQSIYDRLVALKNGMVANAAKWVGQPVATTDIDTATLAITNQDADIEAAKDALSEERSDARTSVKDTWTPLADQTENLARGIHQNEKQKFVDYNIKERKEAETKPIPGKAIIESVKDDDDGIGFKITIQPLDNADDFEIEVAVTAANVPLPDPATFKHLKSTKKLVYIDDEVIAGQRYHYRVHGFNHTGDGELSAIVSAVQ